MKHGGTKRLETERLILRRFTIGDAPQMYANWASNPVITEFLTWPPHSSEEVSRQVLDSWVAGYARPNAYNWALELKENGEVIGSLSVVRADDDIGELELGWCMSRAHWGRGLMPEAAKAVVDYLFNEVGANRVCAKHDVNNPKSGRVMQKIGMRPEGVLRQAGRNNRGVVDLAVYALLASDRREDAIHPEGE